MEDLFDAAAMYDDDYLYFFAAPRGESEFAGYGPAVPGADSSGEAVAELIWRLLDLRPDMSVLDLACGHGEMANRLAARGCRVTGLDSSAIFLDRARPTRPRPESASSTLPGICAGYHGQLDSTGSSTGPPRSVTSTTPPTEPSWMGSFALCDRAVGWRWTWTT
jgi:SAM-dependent methyltransferase